MAVAGPGCVRQRTDVAEATAQHRAPHRTGLPLAAHRTHPVVPDLELHRVDLQAPPMPLLKSGALQAAIVNSTSFSSIATDERGVIQLFNRGAERMLGYAAADVLNRMTPADLSDPQELVERAQELSAEFDMVIAPGFEALVFKASRGIDDIYELTYRRQDGSPLPAMVSVTALRDAQGLLIGYLLIGTDNAARKRVDEALHETHLELLAATQAAESANRAKSDFLSSMSHELRSPLNAILGFAQLMDSGAPQPTPAQKDSIDQILQAGWYLLELINEVLDLALIESGRLSLSPEPMALAEVLADCQAMIEPQACQGGIDLDFVAHGRAAARAGRPHAGQAGVREPAVQRHQVQPRRRPHRGALQPRAGRPSSG
jgi:signal transduction histidine kinase